MSWLNNQHPFILDAEFDDMVCDIVHFELLADLKLTAWILGTGHRRMVYTDSGPTGRSDHQREE